MNQTLIIAHLNYMSQGQERIFEQTLNGFITPVWMKDKGMWTCWTCSYVGCLEDSHCKSCGDEKFIVCEDLNRVYKPISQQPIIIENEEHIVREPYHVPYLIRTKNRSKIVIDMKYDIEYPSCKEAAKINGMSASALCQMLTGKIHNTTNLKYKSL